MQAMTMSLLHKKKLYATSKAAPKKSSSRDKFIPNMKQLREAAEQLPDANTYASSQFSSRLVVDSAVHTVDFNKQKIQRGSRMVSRWIFEGKVLIRNRDQKE